MRWFFEKSDEPGRFWQAKFEGAVVTITSGTWGGESESRTEAFDSLEEAAAAVREELQPLWDQGYAEGLHPDERFRQDERIAQYWREGFLADLKAMGALEREPDDYASRIAENLGADLPPELADFLCWQSSHSFGYTNFGEWRIWDADRWVPRPEDGNLFEQLVISDQQNYLGTALMEQFTGCVFVGTAGNGDSYFAHPNHRDPNQAEVIFFDHETYSPDFAIADSLSTLAWLNRCYVQLGDEEFDHERFVSDMALIENRANLSWHYGNLTDESEIEPEYQPRTNAQYYFYRTYWLHYLLRQNGVVSVEDAGQMFHPDYHADLRFEDALNSPFLRSTPLTALYWLWRLWWFAKPQLAECLDAIEDHVSPIVRDAVALVRELEAGRKTLGKIEDVHALRERWLALDIDPDRAEERAHEQAAAAQRAEQELARRLDEAHGIIARSTPEDVREAMWHFVGDDEILDVFYEHLEHTDPSARPWLRRWEFLANDGANREDGFYEFENFEVLESLAHGGEVLAPRLLGPERRGGSYQAAAWCVGERALPYIVARLSARDEYNVGRTVGALALKVIAEHGRVDDLVELSRKLRWRDAYVDEIRNKKALLAVIEALGAAGGTVAGEALHDLLVNGPPAVHPRTLTAIGRIGTSDARIVTSVVERLGTALSRPAAFALARLPSADGREALAKHVSTLAGSPPALAYERVMLQLARHADGEDVDWHVVELATGIIESKRFEDQELHETVVELLPGHPDSTKSVELLENYLHHDLRAVREAALERLEALGRKPQLLWLDRPTVDALYDSDGVEGLRRALTDRNAIFRHNALRKAVEVGVADQLAREAVDLVGFMTRFEHYTNGYVQDAHETTAYAIEALAQVDCDDALRLLCRLWRGPNAMYRDADTLKYDRDEIHSRMTPFVDEVDAELEAQKPPAPPRRSATLFVETTRLFGACVNGMAGSPDAAFHTDEIAAIRFVGDEVLTASDDGTAIRWSSEGEALGVYRSPEGRLCDVAMDPTAERVFVTGPDYTAAFDLAGNELWRYTPQRSEYLELTDDCLVVASYDALVWLDRETGNVLFGSESFADSFIFRWARLDDRRLAVAGYDDEQFYVWDLDERELLEVWSLPASEKGGVCGLSYAAGRLFVARWDKTIVVLETETGSVVKRAALDGPRMPIAATADGTTLYACGSVVEACDTNSFEVKETLEVSKKLETVAVRPDGALFLGAASGEVLRG